MKKRFMFFLWLLPMSLMAQHTVSGQFSPAKKYKWGLLYQITPTADRYTADTRIDPAGNFTIALDSSVAPGSYRFVYATPPEEFNFEFIYSGKEDIVLTFSDRTGVSFVASEENTLWSRYQQEMAQLNSEIERHYQNGKQDAVAIALLLKMQRELQNKFEKASANKIAGSFIRASKPYLPKKHQDWEAYQLQKKATYFDNIDVNDPVLQESRFLFDRCVDYVRTEKDLNAVAVFLSPASKQFQGSLLTNLYDALVANDLTEMAVYLSKNHLRPLVEELGQLKAAAALLSYENLAEGVIAPNFSWENENKVIQQFHDVSGSNYYILAFWSSGCPHCLKELPELHNMIETLPQDKYRVIAFGLEDDLTTWRIESAKLPLFLHIPGLRKWKNEVAQTYAVNRTPTYYVMDKDKRILFKPATLDELQEVIAKK